MLNRLRLLIIRHAEPDYPRDALTERGSLQAERLALRLAGEGIDRLYSSPLRRALDTARPAAAVLGLPVGIEPWTRELEDWWLPIGPEGERPAWKLDGGMVRDLAPELHPEDWCSLPPFDLPVLRQGFAALTAASDAFLARHGCVRAGRRYRLERPEHGPADRLALVCHAGFGLTWLAHLLAIPPPLIWAGFALPPASVTTIEFEPLPDGGGAAPRCLAVGDVSHLRADDGGHRPHGR